MVEGYVSINAWRVGICERKGVMRLCLFEEPEYMQSTMRSTTPGRTQPHCTFIAQRPSPRRTHPTTNTHTQLIRSPRAPCNEIRFVTPTHHTHTHTHTHTSPGESSYGLAPSNMGPRSGLIPTFSSFCPLRIALFVSLWK